MKVVVGSTLRVTDYPEKIENWCKKNLIVTNPEYVRKVKLGYNVWKTPKEFWLFEKNGDELVLPFGTLNYIDRVAPKGTEYISDFATPIRANFGQEHVPLYDYQERAVEALYEAKFGMLQAPAGCGKTQIGLALAKRYGRRTLWIAHTIDLVRQTFFRSHSYMDASKTSQITEGRVDIADCLTVATIQTLSRMDLTKYKDYWDLIIVDECHRVSGTPAKITQYQKVLSTLSARHKYGLSATIHRADGMIKATRALLGDVVHEITPEDVGEKIMTVSVKVVYTNMPFDRVACLNPDGTLNYPRYVSYIANHGIRNRILLETIIENKGHSCLILSDRLEHLKAIMDYLPDDMREEAVMITGKMTSKSGKERRERSLDDMRSGKKKYLFASYSLAKEGLDIPRLDRLFMCTPQKDFAVISQSIGRIARQFEGKEDPIAYDFVDGHKLALKQYTQRGKHYRKLGLNLLPFEV